MDASDRTRLFLYGPFRLIAPSGLRVDVTSRKGIALLAMLAVAPEGERTRAWLQDRLWGSRQRKQAQGSLRRELCELRDLLAAHNLHVLHASGDRVRLDLSALKIANDTGAGDFLEGIDLPGEEAFEDWLRMQRQVAPSPAPPAAVPYLPVPAGFHRSPSLAILPFANETGKGDLNYLADGISEELVERVSRLRWLPVISSGLAYRPEGSESYLEAGRRLGAAYVLGGRLRRQENDYWLTGQILDCADGRLIWSPRLRLPAPQATNAMSPFVMSLVAALGNRVDDAEQVRARSVPETELSVIDLIWRGRWHQDRLGHEHTKAAGEYFAEAMRRAPESAEAVIQYTRHLAYQIWNARGGPDQFHEIRRLAQRAIVLDPQDARGHMLAGMAEMWLRRPEQAEILLLRAISLNPSLSIAYEQLATTHILAGRPQRGVEMMEMSLRLAPDDYRQFEKYSEMALGWLMQEKYESAVANAEQSISLRPAYWHAHVSRINALVRRGDVDKGRQALADLTAVRPNFDNSYIEWIPFVDPHWHRWLREGLELAQQA